MYGRARVPFIAAGHVYHLGFTVGYMNFGFNLEYMNFGFTLDRIHHADRLGPSHTHVSSSSYDTLAHNGC